MAVPDDTFLVCRLAALERIADNAVLYERLLKACVQQHGAGGILTLPMDVTYGVERWSLVTTCEDIDGERTYRLELVRGQ